MNILLIDKRVSRYEDIVAAIDPALAVGIVFDYFEDTFDTLKVRIRDVGTTSGTSVSVGLVQHNYRAPMFSMLASTAEAETKCTVSRVKSLDPNLATWAQFKEFIVWCKSELNTAHFDMMACALYSDPNWKYVIDTLSLPSQTGITIRASTDNTGAATQGGNWFLESHTGVNLKGVYFTELINEYKGLLILEPYNRNYPTKSFAVGDAILWFPWTITIPDVVAIYFTETAVAALKSNGSVLNADGNIVVSSSSGVIAVYSTNVSFAAIKSDGSVICWTDLGDGSSISPTTISNSGVVVSIYSTQYAFAALKSDGSIVAWGDPFMGGEAPTTVTNANSGVVAVYSTYGAFAALKSDGSVIAWGDSSQGGEAPTTVTAANSGVVTVYSTGLAFAALKTNGSIVAWGDSTYGGLAPSTVTAANSGVVAVYSAQLAFAALKSDGGVVAWGDSFSGGDSSLVASSLLSGVVAVYSNSAAFAALKADGSVVAWGSEPQGGSAPITVTSANSGVVAVYSTDGGAFAALKSNGSLVVWGYDLYGGATGWASSSLTSDVVAVYSVYDTFAALKNDGSIVAWNMAGSYASVAPSTVTNANSGVVAVYSYSSLTFAAIKTTATTFDLSASYYSNMDRYNILRKKENRRRANLTTSNNNVFTLSNATDIKLFNPNIPAGKTFSIIVPAYAASSSYSITSTATIPSGAGNFIVACDDSEPVTISGATYVNFGSYVYKRETNNTYTKLTTATIGGTVFTLYGGDGINSSGIALVNSASSLPVPTLSTFSVPASKTYGDASFNITTAPTSASNGAITYTSNATGVATINASTGVITLVSAGTVTFTASQAETAQYNATNVTSNELTVALGATSLTAFSVAETKTYGDQPFSIAVPTISRAGAITYGSNNISIATIDASTGLITLVSAGTVTFTASQAETTQYEAGSVTSNELTIALGTPILSAFAVPALNAYGAAPFGVSTPAPTSASNGAITYSSNAPSVATINASTGVITVLIPGTVTFTASQAAVPGKYVVASAVTSNAMTVTLAEQTVTTGTSFAGADLSGASLSGATLSGVSFAGASLVNANFSGATVAGTNFTNANISGATNLPAFSTTQKLQLLRNTNNVNISAVQISTPLSGAEINAAITIPIPAIAGGTFVVKAPTYNASNEKVVTVATGDIADRSSIYIPLNSGETVKVNGAAYTFNGTNVLDSNSNIITTLNVLGVPFRIYVGSIIMLNSFLRTPTITAFTVASSKILSNPAFAITARPASNSGGAITYSSNNPSVATIDAAGNLITLQSVGTVTFLASQAEVPDEYAAITVTSNVLTVSPAILPTPVLSSFIVASKKSIGDAAFAITTRPASASNGAITYTSNAGIATIDASGNWITVVGAGAATFTAFQEAVPGEWNSATITSNVLRVPNGPVCAPMNRWFSATNAPRANSSDRISALRARELTRDGTITIASLEGPTDPAPPVNSDWVKIITPQGDPSVVNRLALNSAGASNALLLLSPPQKPM